MLLYFINFRTYSSQVRKYWHSLKVLALWLWTRTH